MNFHAMAKGKNSSAQRYKKISKQFRFFVKMILIKLLMIMQMYINRIKIV